MGHPEQLEFVQITKFLFPEMFVRKKVLEIGSLDINGTIRGLFEECQYTGLDVGPGVGVDIICEGQKYEAPDASFDVVICCEVMEHNPFWADTFRNMIRLLRPGGLMVMSCASRGRREHGTTRTSPGDSPLTIELGWDYYRNLAAGDILREVSFADLSALGFATNCDHWDLYMLGVKAGGGADTTSRVAKFKSIYRRRIVPSLCRKAWAAARSPGRISAFVKQRTSARN